jgi:hypothetical protein
MNSEHETELEFEIDQELKGLPDLEAPETLSRNVILAIERRRSLRWYNKPWQNWPVTLRISALAVLSIMFGALCVASWQLTRAAGASAAFEEVSGIFSGLATVWNIINVLLGAVGLVFRHFGTGFMVACVAIAGLGYALCVGLGTAWVRLAFARR